MENRLVVCWVGVLAIGLCVEGLADSVESIPVSALPTNFGYLPVSENGAKLFHYFYEASAPNGSLGDTPIIFFFAGKDGCSAMTGNFEEVGPYRVDSRQQFTLNPNPWNRLYGVLFMDSPVGTGYSTASSFADIPTDREDQLRDLYVGLLSFFHQNNFESRPLYIAGASRYVSTLAYFIHQRYQESAALIRQPGSLPPPSFSLKGIAVFGITDPFTQVMTYASAAYYFGHIDEAQRDYVNLLAANVVEHIKVGRYDLALDARNEVSDALYVASELAAVGDITRNSAYFLNCDGSDFLTPLLNRAMVKQAFGVPDEKVYVNCNAEIKTLFRNITMKSTKWAIEALLPHYPVLVYTGQFDIMDGPASTQAWLTTLKWEGTSEFLTSRKYPMHIGDTLVGYVRRHKNLTYHVMVGGGHHLAADQPLRAQLMIEGFISGTLGIVQA